MTRIFLTGSAGFIGFHLTKYLCEAGYEVYSVDSVNDYYDPAIKESRLKLLDFPNHRFQRVALEDLETLENIFKQFKPHIVINLAAQAGVRYSMTNPHAYLPSNITGFLNILECCRHHNVEHLLYASSSSVYGANQSYPFSVNDNVDHPLSLYAATKKANELMAHTYAHLYNIPCTGLRFFTVYGPWGRPDMAYFKFIKNIYDGKPIDVYNFGVMKRDFTYIDDIVEGITRLCKLPPKPNLNWDPVNPDPASSKAPYRIYNIGNGNPVDLMEMINIIEQETGIKAEKNLLPMQPGDVAETFADTKSLETDTGFKPDTPLQVGISRFVRWYKEYYKIGNGPAN